MHMHTQSYHRLEADYLLLTLSCCSSTVYVLYKLCFVSFRFVLLFNVTRRIMGPT
ncbi:uncharacterized protein BDW70DRAFT_133259 [Aspergillus foveolatus]|uniref:uncharacterized protein n=1 Tax=Aspergillus foveolatus TaxID=210207 RepID=UPI003CCDED26